MFNVPVNAPLRFLSLPSTQSLEAKLRNSSDSELLRDILQKTVKHPVCVKHPPSVKYARCFLSELIKKAGPGSDGKRKLIMTRNCFPKESTWRWQC
ncbi:putative protein N-methyltransferase FAM86B1 isoform X2 [Pan paniscus]|uniref:putative protein N-methyltransferase FAM86B1 isoform X2 n=1 Tax=Pan paniscus TaxID=9597 RepID=UPI002546494D|nr:putative protein N-methyltransferase FAM86B1 isoform X2 [Pan paniscus]